MFPKAASRFILSTMCFAGGCAAPSAEKPLERIAFGSCAKQDRPQPIWDNIVASKPDVFLFIGDIVYADTTDMAVMRAAYDKLAAIPGYRKLRAACPVLAVWDDHDYGANDGGADYPKREESQREFLRAFDVPADSPRWQRQGVYDARVFGPPGKRVQIILLDMRYFRSPLAKRDTREKGVGPYVPTLDKSATFLGEGQWQWLDEQLRQPADVRIIASTIQFVTEDLGWEKWANIPHERERLLKLIRDCRAEGVTIVSGDRHLAELSAMNDWNGYPLFDLTSSGLNWTTTEWAPQPNQRRISELIWGDNFGMVAIDWNGPTPIIQLEIHKIDGSVPIRHEVQLNDLRFTEPEKPSR